MANVTRNSENNEWDIDVIPGESIKLATAKTYVDGDMNVKAVKVISSKFFDDVWSAPMDKTTAQAKAMNSGNSMTQDGSTAGGQYYIYFGKIRITGVDKTNTTTASRTWDTPWKIRMRVTAKMFYRDSNGNKIYHSDGKGTYEWTMTGSGTNYAYSNFNVRYNWVPQYYDFLNRPVASYTKSLNDSPWLWGINFYSTSSTYSNRSYYKREFFVEVLETENCEMEFLDDWICARNYHIANPTVHPRNSQANYYGYCYNSDSGTDNECSGFINMNAVSDGLQETGDSDSMAYYIATNGFRGYVGANKIYPNCLFAQTSDGNYESFVMSNSTGTTKVKNPHGFLPTEKIYWNSNSSTYSEGKMSFSAYEQYHSIDYRYSFNITTTSLPASCYTYLKWTYSNGLLYLADEWLALQLPTTEDGFIYQRIGSNYYDSADYRGSLLLDNPYYVYDGGIKRWYPDVDNASKLNNQDASYYLNYNNLNNTPTIPTVHNGKLTINVTGPAAVSQEFTANQSGDTEVDIFIPTESTVSSWGFTKNTGTVTNVGVKVNGATKGTVTSSGTIDLGTLATSDTKNTAGSTNTSSKIFLIGATSQATNPQTYSHDTAYVGTDGCLYSGNGKVLNLTLTDSKAYTQIESPTRNYFFNVKTPAGTGSDTYNRSIISIYNASEAGHDVYIEGGNATVLGGGESATSFSNYYGTLDLSLGESPYITGDSHVYICPGLNKLSPNPDTNEPTTEQLAAMKNAVWTFNTNGHLYGRSLAGTGNRMIYANSSGGLYASTTRGADTIVNFCNAYSSQTSAGTISVASGTETLLQSYSLTKGSWLAEIHVSFASNATGYRRIYWNFDNSANAKDGLISSYVRRADNGTDTYLKMMALVRVTNASETFYLRGFQNSGSALNANPRCRFIRLCND